MTNSIDDKLGRRSFLKGAAKTAAIGATAITGQTHMTNAQQTDDNGQDHDHQTVPSDIALRVKALETVLVEKQMIDPADIDEVVDTYENKVGPRNGAQVVARASLVRRTHGLASPRLSLRVLGLRRQSLQ